MILHGIETILKEVRILLGKNNPMNWDYMICVEMYGNGLKRQHIRMLPTLNLMAIFSFVGGGAGGMKIRTAASHVAMYLTDQKRLAD